MKEVCARLDIEVFVDCPHCDRLLNILNSDDTGGYDHNDVGQVLSQACPNGHWTEEHENFSVEDVECSNCHKSFNIKGLDW